jgi:hypothetical protein
MRLLRPGERLAAAFLALVGQHRLHSTIYSARGEALADALDRVAADVEGVADLGLAPARAEFERDLGNAWARVRVRALLWPRWMQMYRRSRSSSDKLSCGEVSVLDRVGMRRSLRPRHSTHFVLRQLHSGLSN